MRDLEQEKDSLNEEIGQVEGRMNETLKENDELRQQLVSSRQELNKIPNLELTTKEYEAQIEELERCLDERNLQIKQMNIKLENYEMEMESAFDKINTLKNMNDTYNMSIQQTENQKRKVRGQHIIISNYFY